MSRFQQDIRGLFMSGFSTARQKMVDGQVRTADVTDSRILDAMLEVPREAFVPANRQALAYLDLDLDVSAEGGPKRYLIKPVVTAKLMQAAEIKAGDKVVMWFAAGNRDEAVFEDPYRFDVTRTNIDHLTFGKGSPHACLGSSLARMEIRLMFTELIPRIASIELNGEVTRVRSNFVNGIKKFPVRVQAN